MIGWIVRQISWRSFGIGVGTTVVGGYVLRPLLVSAVKSGFAMQAFAADTWQQVRSEAARVHADATKAQIGGQEAGALLKEFTQIRNDVGLMKAKLAGGAVQQ
jgi:hypothetical protein